MQRLFITALASLISVSVFGQTVIAGGGWHSLAIRSDGTAVGWGKNNDGQCNVPNRS